MTEAVELFSDEAADALHALVNGVIVQADNLAVRFGLPRDAIAATIASGALSKVVLRARGGRDLRELAISASCNFMENLATTYRFDNPDAIDEIEELKEFVAGFAGLYRDAAADHIHPGHMFGDAETGDLGDAPLELARATSEEAQGMSPWWVALRRARAWLKIVCTISRLDPASTTMMVGTVEAVEAAEAVPESLAGFVGQLDDLIDRPGPYGKGAH